MVLKLFFHAGKRLWFGSFRAIHYLVLVILKKGILIIMINLIRFKQSQNLSCNVLHGDPIFKFISRVFNFSVVCVLTNIRLQNKYVITKYLITFRCVWCSCMPRRIWWRLFTNKFTIWNVASDKARYDIKTNIIFTMLHFLLNICYYCFMPSVNSCDVIWVLKNAIYFKMRQTTRIQMNKKFIYQISLLDWQYMIC